MIVTSNTRGNWDGSTYISIPYSTTIKNLNSMYIDGYNIIACLSYSSIQLDNNIFLKQFHGKGVEYVTKDYWNSKPWV